MRTAKIGELKAKLSAHIQFMKNGEEVPILDRKLTTGVCGALPPFRQGRERIGHPTVIDLITCKVFKIKKGGVGGY